MATARIITFGCKTNQYEGDALASALAKAGFRMDESAEPDVAIVNSCTVTEKADRRARQAVLRIAREHPKARIYITGCYAVREADKLRRLPNVAGIYADKGELANAISKPARGTGRRAASTIVARPPVGRAGRAYLKIQDGCDARCSYCIVPLVRPTLVSKPLDDILREAREIVAAGFLEIVVTGINLGRYSAYVAHPPSGVSSVSSPVVASSEILSAKPARPEYRRDLPHLQPSRRTFFITFSTQDRWTLPESVRRLVLEHCLHDHGSKHFMHGLVVMPDHVHLVLTPMEDSAGNAFGLAEIMNGIKGASSHSINRELKRRGSVWQKESFDHVLRSEEEIRKKVEYICLNPVRKGLVGDSGEYPWLWREWVEGQEKRTQQQSHPGAGVPHKQQKQLADVVRLIAETPGLARLRLSSIEMPELADDLIDLMATHPKTCPHVHLPLQSGDTGILKAMNRRYTPEQYLATVKRIRSRIPDAAITTDIIVGFPDESDEAFERTLRVAREARFSKVHVFRFSARPGTRASGLPGHVTERVVTHRKHRLMALADELALDYSRGFVGRDVDVIVETVERGESGAPVASGLTERYQKVTFQGGPGLIGSVVRVTVERARPGALEGRLKDEVTR